MVRRDEAAIACNRGSSAMDMKAPAHEVQARCCDVNSLMVAREEEDRAARHGSWPITKGAIDQAKLDRCCASA